MTPPGTTTSLRHLLVVSCDDGLWALPMDAVEQTVDLSSLRRRRAGTGDVVSFRDQTIELHDLAGLLHGGSPAAQRGTGVVIWGGGRRRVLALDHAVGQFSLECQPLPSIVADSRCGAVTQLDGKIVPVLEPGPLVGAWTAGDGRFGFSDMQRSALAEIANIGSARAATALSQLLGRPIEVGYTEALLATLAEAADRVGAAAARSTVVDTPISNANGKVLLLFPDESSSQLCQLLGVDSNDPVGLSALAEVGNILTTSYLNALVEMTGLELEPEPPSVEIGVLGSLVQDSLAGASPDDPTILMRSRLEIEASDASFVFLFVPQLRSVHQLLDSLGLAA
jgi:chemotaxis protein CheC